MSFSKEHMYNLEAMHALQEDTAETQLGDLWSRWTAMWQAGIQQGVTYDQIFLQDPWTWKNHQVAKRLSYHDIYILFITCDFLVTSWSDAYLSLTQ